MHNERPAGLFLVGLLLAGLLLAGLLLAGLLLVGLKTAVPEVLLMNDAF